MGFVSQAIEPLDAGFDATVMSRGEPALPHAFRWKREDLRIAEVTRRWRSTKDDRGDTYLKRHWFECRLIDGRTAVIYFDRGARRGQSRWWLYTLDS